MNKQMGTVLVGTSVNVEVNIRTDRNDIHEFSLRIQEAGVQTIKRVLPFGHLRIGVAGSSRNVAHAMMQFGHENVRLLGTIASDDFGDLVIKTLASERIDFRPLIVRERTNVSINIASIGDDPGVLSHNFKAPLSGDLGTIAGQIRSEVIRTRPVYRVATGVQTFDAPLVEAMFLPAYNVDGGSEISSTNVVNLGMTMFKAAVENETESERRRWLKKLLKLTSVLVLNSSEETELLRSLGISSIEQLRAEVQNSSLSVLITCGRQGARYHQPESDTLEVKSFTAPIEVDPTGAGDCFLGNFIAAQLEGHDLQTALKYAAAASALSVAKLGGNAAPRRNEIEALISRSVR